MFRLTSLLCLLGAFLYAPAQTPAQTNDEWVRAVPPFRIIGNIYWVGTYDLSTYLITTPAGNILINTGLASTVPQIQANVEKLGFKMSDTKILTATHGHFDHVAGLAELKRKTGAQVVMSAPDVELLESGGKVDYLFGDRPSTNFEPVKVDRSFQDGEKISLGGVELTAHHHPGHTKGAMSFTTTVSEGGKSYRVVIANMGSINPGTVLKGMPKYPGIGADYAKTFASQKDMQVDVFLASHASQFGLYKKYQSGDSYKAGRFVDPQGFHAEVERLEKAYRAQMEREEQGR